MIKNRSVVTLTFGEQAENHVGMEQIGEIVPEGEGFNYNDLVEIKEKFNKIGTESNIHNLEISDSKKSAYILIIKNGIDCIYKDLGLDIKIYNRENLFKEQSNLELDKKCFMRGKVVNKRARWNLCFDNKSSEPDYENKKGRVIGYDEVKLTKKLYDAFPTYFGEKSKNLKGEGNYYYDITSCGIGFHGDSERRRVLALRLGASMPIYYQWYYKTKRVGEKMRFQLDGGDIYIMEEKAVGTDWKKRNSYTLRHSTGCDKYTK